MSKITDIDKKIAYIKEFVNRVFINHNKDTNEFLVKIRLNLPLYQDKLVWNNKRDKSKGYMIEEGSMKFMKNLRLSQEGLKKKDL